MTLTPTLPSAPHLPLLIVNSDDLGLNAETNAAVFECFERRLCSSATIMANMPGFEEACDGVRQRKLEEYIGIHFVLTEGSPLSDSIKRCDRLCGPDGQFRLSRQRRLLRLRADERVALTQELRAQIGRIRASGIPISHLDSHQHIHEEPAIARWLLSCLRQERVPFLRLARNCGEATSVVNHIYRSWLNRRIVRHGLAGTHVFGSLPDYRHFRSRASGRTASLPCEVMIHAAFDASGRLIDKYSGCDLETARRDLWMDRPISSFHEVAARYNRAARECPVTGART